MLDPSRQIRGLDDSKELNPDRREVLAERIRERSLAWAVGASDAFEIDRVNILEASRLAMQRALASLAIGPGIFSHPHVIRCKNPPAEALDYGDGLFLHRCPNHPKQTVSATIACPCWDESPSRISFSEQ